MNFFARHPKKAALALLLVMTAELFTPTFAYALTSGPAQPETQGFEPMGNTDMVDLFSGDFSYNIPLMDVGGYPVNLSYHSGASMDEEASWVGYGWSLNVGAINRQLRGLPDDFNGTDYQEREINMKDHITKGARFSATLDLLGIPVPKINKKVKKRKLNFTNPTVSVGVTFDNYRGVGVDIGANAGLSLSDYAAGDKNPSDKGASQALGQFGLTLSSMDGASISLNPSILSKSLDLDEKTSISKSVGFGYNSRAGLTGMTLTNSMRSSEGRFSNRSFDISSSHISFTAPTYTPSIDRVTKATSFTFSLHLGFEAWVAFPGVGGSGFYSKQTTAERVRRLPAYGYLHSEKGKENQYALMDFNREKDIPYHKEIKYLPIAVPTYDLFSASSQDGGGQYRAYRGGSTVYADPKTEMKSDNNSVGVEAGPGFYFDLGADLYTQDITTTTKKWINRNRFLAKGDHPAPTHPLDEAAYFKRVGEPVPMDEAYVSAIKGTGPVAVSLPQKLPNGKEGAEASDQVRTKQASSESIGVLKRNKREVRNTAFSYLTAKEASLHALEKTIKDYHPDALVYGGCASGGVKSEITRNGGYRKGHHISEVTITGDDGKRTVYGIPVYNTLQEEVSFSTGWDSSKRKKGLVSYSKGVDDAFGNRKGREHYYSKETTPPYATSYLLTALLSADYVDRTGDGVTDDDHGTAVKFNYSKLDQSYHWRTPYASQQDQANYQEGFLSDTLDDKANYVYGQKEVWYLHSIESKTMVAHFITADREDGLGVLNSGGGVDSSNRLKRLKEIRLYSKSDLMLNGNDPAKTIPVKVVHLGHSYSICRGLPNSLGSAGKLTLDSVYFTFGRNNKGSLNPYKFHYDTAQYNRYDYRQYDRWGNFKDAAKNPGGLNNSEFPYVLQNTALANQFASLWQLTQIQLPTGGTIQASYESDDYGYVQDRRAMQMCMIKGIGEQGDSTGLIHAESILVDLPAPVSGQQEMMEKYFEGVKQLYFKFLLDLDGQGHREFVPGYAEIEAAERLNDTTARIKLKKINGRNPMAKAGWQFIRLNLPKYAYPGSDTYESQDSDLKKIIMALVGAFGNITELIRGFEKRAEKQHFSDKAVLSQSWVRLCAPEKKKLGGGVRVKRIDLSDNWAVMTGVPGAKTATYSQLYDYTTTDEKNNTISSGVASYEPQIGGDENPFRLPVNYKQKQPLGLANYFYLEEPFGESLFPAATVGYSKVTVKSIGSDDDESSNRTGTTVSEFYTAKEYPTLVSILGLEDRKVHPNKLFTLIGGLSYDVVGLSQGYSIELNDMHGKPWSVNVFNRSGQKISSVEYFYKTDNGFAEKRQLNNDVQVVTPDGAVQDGTIGMDVEIYTDMREQTTNNQGFSIKVSGGSGAILFFPLPFFFPGVGMNIDKRSYRAASTIKIVNRFAVQYKVKKTQNGSSITTENLAWDAETGNVLLSKTQNEFDDPIYSFAYPAHWAYGGMGQAYQNLGTVLTQFSTAVNSTISNAVYRDLLTPGDELINLKTAEKYWVVSTPVSGAYEKRIIDQSGALQTLASASVKLLRSGRRNMAGAAIATITSLNNPVAGGRLDVAYTTKILDAKATVFSEEWSVPVPNSSATASSSACSMNTSCMEKFIKALMVVHNDLPTPKAFLYTASSDYPVSAFGIFDSAYADPDGSCLESFINNSPASEFRYFLYNSRTQGGSYYISNGDSASLGTCKLYFDFVTTRFNFLANNSDTITDLDQTTPCDKQVAVVNYSSNPCAFSVIELPTKFGSDSCATIDTLLKFRLSCLAPPSGCVDPLERIINPYYAGLLGNWRSQSQFVFQVNRENLQANSNLFASTNIRKSGAYVLFSPFWLFNPTQHLWSKNADAFNAKRWIAANQVTYFNSKGTEIENKDALDRYSAALFGYLESLPVAVASNARHRELAYDGFEDYNFAVDCAVPDTCNSSGHFNFIEQLGSSASLSNSVAHSGKFSLALSGNITLTKTVYTPSATSLFAFDNNGQYILKSNELAKGFSPIPGKKYLLSFWVKDGQPRNPSTSVQATLNDSALIGQQSPWPIVEGWKKVEVPFTLSVLATNFKLDLSSSAGTVYIDDIRIHPLDGQMKSFAYDPSSQRLMAEGDENNFTTFYEYDDEGILVRVKKETERGIMTLKETRSGYRKNL